MSIINDPCLEVLKKKLSPESWNSRVAEAERQADLIKRILEHESTGATRSAAIRQVCPGDPISTWNPRIEKYGRGGWQALVNRRHVEAPERLTPAVEGFILGLLSGDSQLRSLEIVRRVKGGLGMTIGGSTVRYFLREKGLAQPRGRPTGQTQAEPLPLAGAELLKAVEVEVGAVAKLTRDQMKAFEELPATDGPLRDTLSNRDDHGRFLSAYNEKQAKADAEVAPKFRSVAETSGERDLQEMRAANSSYEALYRKNYSLTMLPLVTDSTRWSTLEHWQGDYLGTLVGYPYQASTLEKHLGELKMAELSDVALFSVASFWTAPGMHPTGPLESGVILYADTTTKPIWTHDFARCAKVSKAGNRVMPATSTLALHAGCGTPLIYRSFSGRVSLPAEVGALLEQWEELAGDGTAQRLIVMDREAHATWFFKELPSRWLYIIPLCTSVTGPNARFEELEPWEAYGEHGDQTREGFLWLNDSHKKDAQLRVRVVARKRHRTGKVAWFATSTERESFGAGTVIDLYFRRWPAQEHVFRNANGRVGLGVHHGFGRALVQNVAVIDQIEKLEGRHRKNTALYKQASQEASEIMLSHDRQVEAVKETENHVAGLRKEVDRAVDKGSTQTPLFRENYKALQVQQDRLPKARAAADAMRAKNKALTEKAMKAKAAADLDLIELERRTKQTRVFTVDVELDQIMTAFKLTFMNLCGYFLVHYFGDRKVELDTLIKAVFTLPGERVRTRATETIRIYRQPRERKFMPLVEEACRLLTEKRLFRDKRRLVFEVVDQVRV